MSKHKIHRKYYVPKQKKYNIPGLLVLIDLIEKAFDTIEWDFLFESLKAYNFGQTFRVVDKAFIY